MKIIKLKDLKFLDEVDILYPKPKKIPIGKKYIIIKELPLSYVEKLSTHFRRLIKKYDILTGIKVPENIKELNEKTENFVETVEIIEALLKSKKFRRAFSRLLKIAMPEIGRIGFPSLKYIEENITETEAIQIMIAIWVYNFASDLDCKKKVQKLVKEMI